MLFATNEIKTRLRPIRWHWHPKRTGFQPVPEVVVRLHVGVNAAAASLLAVSHAVVPPSEDPRRYTETYGYSRRTKVLILLGGIVLGWGLVFLVGYSVVRLLS